LNYKLERIDDDELDELDDEGLAVSSSRELDLNYNNLDVEDFDDVDRVTDCN
jgi:hypothetical protein